MSEWTELQKKAVAEARQRLFSFDDYVGIDADSVPTHAQIEAKGIPWAVQKIVEGTTSNAAPYRDEW